nr:MAG TPA: PLAT/LH2 and C2-like Ca2+-binding lipoprotein [Caudoviricetes sp.]
MFLSCGKDKSAKAKSTVKQYVITLEQTYLK